MSGRFGEENEAVWATPGLDKLPASAEVVVTVYRDQKHPKTVMVPVEGMMASDYRRNAEVARWRMVCFVGNCPWGNARSFVPQDRGASRESATRGPGYRQALIGYHPANGAAPRRILSARVDSDLSTG